MGSDEVKAQLKDLISEILEIDKEDVKEDANFFEELGADSMLGLEVVAAVEREFDIKIEDEEVSKLVTFNNVLEIINAKLKLKN